MQCDDLSSQPVSPLVFFPSRPPYNSSLFLKDLQTQDTCWRSIMQWTRSSCNTHRSSVVLSEAGVAQSCDWVSRVQVAARLCCQSSSWKLTVTKQTLWHTEHLHTESFYRTVTIYHSGPVSQIHHQTSFLCLTFFMKLSHVYSFCAKVESLKYEDFDMKSGYNLLQPQS